MITARQRQAALSLGFTMTVCLALALIIYAFEVSFFAYRDILGRFPRPGFSIVETAGLLFLLALALKPKGFFAAVVTICFLGLLQWLHLSYFGTFIHPNAMYLFLTNLGEVFETARSFVGRIVFPIVLFAAQVALIKFALYQAKPRTHFVPWMKWVLIVALVYPPIRTFVSGNTYGKQPAVHNLGFSNIYASFSYFAGKILPYKLSHREQTVHLEALKVQSSRPQRHVVLIMGESLRYHNLSLFGYQRPTTPHLDQIAKENHLVYRKAFSGGVSTDVSVPMFFNNHQGFEAAPVIISQKRCLFALAQNNGFGTHYISAQTQASLQHILNYICPTAIDHLQVGAPLDVVEEDLTFHDEILIDALKKINLETPQFIVLHQRGSHSPYNLRYPKDKAAFALETADSYEVGQIKHYDNSVHYTDWVISELIKDLKVRSQIPFDLIYTSDHGQALGENGVWGHVMLNEYVHRVPFLFYSSNQDEFFKDVTTWPEYTHHQEISRLLIRLLGYESPPTPPNKTFFVMGPDLDGLDGGWLFDFSVYPPVRILDESVKTEL
ncbi:MAG: phosphoethanolamine transferase [Bdellovibrio sp.]|jgi:glucan phosphoethanolaminetransferase (alkaline phosphatase superfamily)